MSPLDSTTNQTSTVDANEIISNSTTITLDSQAIAQQNRLTFSLFNHQHGLFDQSQYRVLTRVVSLTIDRPELTQDLGAFVKINFYLEKDLHDDQANLTCAYWHIYENRTAQWSTHGCALIGIKDRNVLCECNHLTHFAILMVRDCSLMKMEEFRERFVFRMSNKNQYRKYLNEYFRLSLLLVYSYHRLVYV